ncbi:Biotin_lipoyl domain-containing protein [Cephalotus follicularis]|uniref:Biotin_lipoyl domain-containing protein n=1 Tax=Cephalotus follicularis TaxID=3775 RepID=A0A1Q3B3G8_CEPFO|nr:Biotin_lipoyl domain-containing protein [Cephalotus follicularis]
MDSSAVHRSFHYSAGCVSNVRSVLERPGMFSMHYGSWLNSSKLYNQVGDKLNSPSRKRNGTIISCVKASDAPVIAKSDVILDGTVSSDSTPQGSTEKSTLASATFPNGIEALVLEVCDETEIAELKLKIGDFEMHMKRNIGATKSPLPNILPTSPPPIPTKPMEESASVAPPPSQPKSISEKASPFTNVSFGKPVKLAALEVSGSKNYVLVLSPTVGSFRKNRTVKGKRQPPICKEGDVIKKGQVIGYLDQFGTELPVKSDVAGEVLKLLFDDGGAVGFGDPLIAVLPSFHGI